MKNHNQNGIFYYLGNTPSHITHALPLYQKLGGVFIVTSNKSKASLTQYNVPVLCIDNVNTPLHNTLDRIRAKLKLPVYKFKLGRSLQKTFNFLEDNAKIVIFYELFEFTNSTKLRKPKTIFLTHGNMLKSYFGMYPQRKTFIKDYDYMAGLGPALKNQLTEQDGIDRNKLIDIGVARTDEIYQAKHNPDIRKKISATLNTNPNKKVVSYLPTFWGASSVYNTGKKLLNNIDASCTVIVKLHPDIPMYLLNEYKDIINKSKNIHLISDTTHPALDIPTILAGSDVILGDVSSIMLEAILVDKPIIFVYDIGEHRQKTSDYRLIPKIVGWSEHIDIDNASKVNAVINSAIKKGINQKIWSQTKESVFFDYNGTAVQSIAQFIESITKEE